MAVSPHPIRNIARGPRGLASASSPGTFVFSGGSPPKLSCVARRRNLRRSDEMKKWRRSALWLAVVLAVGVLLTPQRGAAGPYRMYVPEEVPRMGDPDGGTGGRSELFNKWSA